MWAQGMPRRKISNYNVKDCDPDLNNKKDVGLIKDFWKEELIRFSPNFYMPIL